MRGTAGRGARGGREGGRAGGAACLRGQKINNYFIYLHSARRSTMLVLITIPVDNTVPTLWYSSDFSTLCSGAPLSAFLYNISLQRATV